MSQETQQKITRRRYLKYLGAGVVVAAAAGASTYFLLPKPAPTKTLVGFASYASLNSWEAAYNDAFAWYCGDIGVPYTWSASERSTPGQNTQIHQLVDVGINALVIGAFDPFGINNSIDYAASKGIPIITTNSDADDAAVLLYIGVSMVDSCKGIGERIAAYLHNKYGDYKGTVLHIRGDMANASGQDRDKGIHLALDQYPNIKLLQNEAGWTQSKATTITQDALRANGGNIDAVAAENGDMGIGAVAGFDAAGYDPTTAYIATVDAYPQVIKLIKAGKMALAMDQCPLDYNPLAVYFLLKYLKEGQSAIPKVGTTIAAADIPLSTGKTHVGADIWGPARWAPATVVSVKTFHPDWKNDHPCMVLHNVEVTKANCDDPSLWGNMAIPGFV